MKRKLTAITTTLVALSLLSGCSAPTFEEQAEELVIKFGEAAFVRGESPYDFVCNPPADEYVAGGSAGAESVRLDSAKSKALGEDHMYLWLIRDYPTQEAGLRVEVQRQDGKVCVVWDF